MKGAGAAFTVIAALATVCGFSGCFTGVEGTGKVTLSTQEQRTALPTQEDLLLADIVPVTADKWEVGKRFVCLDDRAALIFDPRTLSTAPLDLRLYGKVLRFTRLNTSHDANGRLVYVLVFADTDREYLYEVRGDVLPDNLSMPMMADYEIIEEVDRRLRGKILWTKSMLWATSDSTATRSGRKYVPVTIDSVAPGYGVFPAQVYFTDKEIKTVKGSLPITFHGSGIDSRTFSTQFSLTDPKATHPKIDHAVWQCIQEGRVQTGMTKEECRLSLGSPADVSEGHNTAMVYEIWQYPNGIYLMFEDGVLFRFTK